MPLLSKKAEMHADLFDMSRERARGGRFPSPEPSDCSTFAAIPDAVFVDASVSITGLQNIQTHWCSKNFEFVLGEISYYCPKSAADFISPKISVVHEIDSILGCYFLNIPEGN
jgi:hypothetical protein